MPQSESQGLPWGLGKHVDDRITPDPLNQTVHILLPFPPHVCKLTDQVVCSSQTKV